jgi:AraC family transcriptional regulator of adaptative response/methylated-DNA-[protein]-cysteine methyltransferase
MSTDKYALLSADYARIEQAILYLERNFRQQPSLKEIADSMGLSEYHFQRLFTRWAGISPKRFLQFLTVEYAKALLTDQRNLLDVTYETGLSSPGRLHDLFVACEAITPGEYKKNGQDVTINYGFHPSPFGECLIATTDRGICGLFFITGQREEAFRELASVWSEADFVEDPDQTLPLAERIFDPVRHTQALPVVLKGTNFQLKVWQALLRIPAGSAVSYDAIAAHIGQPGAARAVGNAVARNPVGYVIPCHRVIRKTGLLGKYHWGSVRKKAILGWEASQRHTEVEAKGLVLPNPQMSLDAVPA